MVVNTHQPMGVVSLAVPSKPGALYLFCAGDGIADYAEDIDLKNNEGEYSQWVITDVEGNILTLMVLARVLVWYGTYVTMES